MRLTPQVEAVWEQITIEIETRRSQHTILLRVDLYDDSFDGESPRWSYDGITLIKWNNIYATEMSQESCRYAEDWLEARIGPSWLVDLALEEAGKW